MKTQTPVALVSILAGLMITSGWAATDGLPQSLPDYYSPAFEMGGKPLNPASGSQTENTERREYSTEGGSVGLSLEIVNCDRAGGKVVFGNVLRSLSAKMGKGQGFFRTITETEAHATITGGDVENNVLVYLLPGSIHIWAFAMGPRSRHPVQEKFEGIRAMANRQRYEEASKAGNVALGVWGKQICEFAETLLRSGRKAEALSVLKKILATSPCDYNAHMVFATNTPDAGAASESARIVLENAESDELLARAAELLGKKPADFEAIPVLGENESGLQVILLPLSPCSPWLLEEAAKVCEEMMGIPVKIRRLKQEWRWSEPDRIPRQRVVQGILLRQKEGSIDFSNWTKAQYLEELRGALAVEDPLSRYYGEQLITEVLEDSGQYFVDPYLENLCKILTSYRSNDKRTMYVGVTEANIYSGDNNFLFSLGRVKGKSRASIMSYHMMLAETLKEDYELRRRLVERMAKEMVPASLKQLGIPRSTDPRCPYSYSSGVSRLDEKSLTLSGPVKEAISALKAEPASGVE